MEKADTALAAVLKNVDELDEARTNWANKVDNLSEGDVKTSMQGEYENAAKDINKDAINSLRALVDTYKAKAVGKDASTTVTIAGYEVDVKVNVSAAAGNALTLKDDGLYVPTPEEVDISGKADKATGATTGNLAALDGEGNLTDSGKKPADFVAAEAGKRLMTDAEGEKLAGVSEGATKTAASSTNGNVNIDGKEVVVYTEPENVLHDEDVEDFSAEEIAALLAD